MHGPGVAEGDVFVEVVAFKEDAGLIRQPLGGDLPGGWVGHRHAPPVAVADLIDALTALISATGRDGDGGVVVAADNDVAELDILVTGHPHIRHAALGIDAVQSEVDGVGDLPAVAVTLTAWEQAIRL